MRKTLRSVLAGLIACAMMAGLPYAAAAAAPSLLTVKSGRKLQLSQNVFKFRKRLFPNVKITKY